MFRRSLLALLLANLCTFGGSFAAEEKSADAKLEVFFRDYLEQVFQLRPMDATRLGDHRFDNRLDDLSAAARKEWLKLDQRMLQQLESESRSWGQLSANGRLDYEIFRQELRRAIWLAENTYPFEIDPRIYGEYISDSVYLLLAQSTLPKETNLKNCIERMGQAPRILEAAKQNLKNPTRVATETAIRQNLGAISFFQNDLFAMAGSTPQLPALQQAAIAVVASLSTYQQYLEQELLPEAHGEWRLGKEKFAQKLDMVLDAGLSADQVLAEAEAEFERVEREMYVIARQLWSRYYPRSVLPPDDAEGRHQVTTKVLQAVAQEHGSAETLASDARATVTRIQQFIRDHEILSLPDPDRCQVIEMPEFQRGNHTAYLNPAPPLDPLAPSYYAVSPPPKDWDAAKVRSFFEEYNRHMLQILTIHEAFPGHYVQLEYANRHPSLIRRVLGSGVYIEGWAVYTEQMLLDQGYGEGELPLRLTQLKFYLRAVANAILDHKMHCSGMTDDEALDLLMRRAFQSEGEARLKVIRAKQTSTQLSTYFVGRTMMVRTRRELQNELQSHFRLDHYHEALLNLGAVPVKYLSHLLREKLQGE